MKPNRTVIKVLSALSRKSESIVLRTWELSCQTCNGNSVSIMVKTASALKIKFSPFTLEIGDRVSRTFKVAKITAGEVIAENSIGEQTRYSITHFLLLNILSH